MKPTQWMNQPTISSHFIWSTLRVQVYKNLLPHLNSVVSIFPTNCVFKFSDQSTRKIQIFMLTYCITWNWINVIKMHWITKFITNRYSHKLFCDHKIFAIIKISMIDEMSYIFMTKIKTLTLTHIFIYCLMLYVDYPYYSIKHYYRKHWINVIEFDSKTYFLTNVSLYYKSIIRAL